MESSHRPTFFSSISTYTTVTYTFHDDFSTPTSLPNSTHVPIPSSSEDPIPITVDLPHHRHHHQSTAAIKIQSYYRSHLIRTLYKTISAIDSETTRLQNLIQLQETVDSIRSNEREKLRMNEALMRLLLKLDSVPGINPTVREARRKVSRRIVGLQEILDAISDVKMMEGDDGFVGNWDDLVWKMEEEVCRGRGGDEMEPFCAMNLGFRCLQRFLREL